MIWICSLFLLAVAAWFFFNGLNERRWVEAHSHDETVASDEGLLSALTVRTSTGSQNPDGKMSIDQENSRFAKAVRKVQDKTSGYSEKFFESKAAEARIDDPDKRPRSASEENTVFGRAVAVVRDKADKMDEKLDGKLKRSFGSRAGEDGEESFLSRTSKRVAATSDDMSQRVASGAKNLAQSIGNSDIKSKGSALLSSASGKVSSGMQKFEASRADRATKSQNADKDLVSRVAEKVGSKMNEMENKTKKAAQSETE